MRTSIQCNAVALFGSPRFASLAHTAAARGNAPEKPRASASRAHSSVGCGGLLPARSVSGHNAQARESVCGGRSPLHSRTRRDAAALSIEDACGVFSFIGGIHAHGLIASTVFMGGRAGGLSASRLRVRGTSYPARPALPVGRENGSKQFVLGASAMSNTYAMRGVHTRAYPLPKTVASLADLRPLFETAPDQVRSLPGEYLIACAAFVDLLDEYARETLRRTADEAWETLDREEAPTAEATRGRASALSLCAVILDECERARAHLACAERPEGDGHA